MPFLFIFAIGIVSLLGVSARAADVTLDPSQTFQTIVGWGHGGGILGATEWPTSMLDPAVADPVNFQYLDYLVDDTGLTGSRTWEVGPRVDGTGMDHGNCDVVDWSLFQSDTFSPADAKYLRYFQDRVIAEGFQPSFYSSPGYPTHATELRPWVMNHPGERAQQMWASAWYMKNTYGIKIDYAVINNEPSLPATILAEDAKAVAPRFAAQGLGTRVQYAEAVAPQPDWNYVTPFLNDADLWTAVGRISYHNYGTADPYRGYLRDFALAHGLTTAQTEMGDPTFDDLYNDLTLGRVSYWEVAYSGSATLTANPGLTSFTPAAHYFRLRQVLHYVRPGAVRIRADSNDPAIHALAFTASGTMTTIVENTSGAALTVTVNGLPPGTYGLSESAGKPFQELGVQTVGANGSLVLSNLPGGGTVATLYPYAGPNHPPTIEVWGSKPGFLVAPASTATLSVLASDPERDPLTYEWSVACQPSGANALLAAPNTAICPASNLTVPGNYAFNVNVRDGINTTSKKVYLVVYANTPPPVLGQTGFRIGAPYGLVFGKASGTTHAHIELPTSSATLQVGISDIADSNFNGRGLWSVISQPAGAHVTLSSTTYIFVSIRANVTGMTVPGDYVFQVNVTDPGRPDLTAQVICTVNAASAGPIISSVSGNPSALTASTGTSQLAAVTSDPAGQLLRHWWAVKSAPAGARPVFDHQGLASTMVSNLVVPGNYVFTLRAFDDIHMSTKDLTLTVR